MLVLNRRKEQAIIINANIEIIILNVSEGGVVSLGIRAPENITVNRLEIENIKRIERSKIKTESNALEKEGRPNANFQGFIDNKLLEKCNTSTKITFKNREILK
jgi:carbon storage regulator CsrA